MLRHALALAPEHPGAINNLGMVWSDVGNIDSAIACFEHACALEPDNPQFHCNVAMTRLRCGEFNAGWPRYEWRLSLNGIAPRRFAQPRWRGEPLHGRRIFLHTEQGFGDMIQFLRYVPGVVERGGRVILETRSELFPLVLNYSGVEQIVCMGDAPGDFDLYCPLLSVPAVLGTTLENLPSAVPYLTAPAASAAIWHQRLGGPTNLLRVGLAWRGRPQPRGRSIPINIFAPLALPGRVIFYSLQIEPLSPTDSLPNGLDLTDLSSNITDFAELAGIITQMDLVISIDTAVAHLAGAMGKPVWVLLPKPADWRWLLDRTDSPWYPSMRLFRQQVRGQWGPVLQSVAVALKQQVQH